MLGGSFIHQHLLLRQHPQQLVLSQHPLSNSLPNGIGPKAKLGEIVSGATGRVKLESIKADGKLGT